MCLAIGAVELVHITPVYHLPASPGEESEQSFGKLKWTMEGRPFNPDNMIIKWEKKGFFLQGGGNRMRNS